MACRTTSRDIIDDEKLAGLASNSNSPQSTSCDGWDGPNDSSNPRNFSSTWKWTITSTALLATLLIPMNGTSITAATPQISAVFDIQNEPFPNSYWTVFSWTLGGAAFLIAGMSIMEDVGVRRSFMVLYAFFILMIIPQALAKNFATLIVTRFFSGGCVALLANTASSIIPDLWATEKERSLPISIWILCYLLGNTLGPPMYAGIVQRTGNWRWIFYAQLIIYASLIPIFWFLIQETRDSVILRHRMKRSRKDERRPSVNSLREAGTYNRLAKAATRPFYLLFTEPVLMAITLWSSFAFGTVFMFTQSIEFVFGQYDWNSYDISYIQVTVAIGEILGWLVSLYGIQLYFKSASRNTEMPGHPIPEARLYLSCGASFTAIAGGMFIYAWTSHVHWIVPAIGLALVGLGIQLVVTAAADYIEDAYAASNFAASAISGCALGENVVAGCLPLATARIYNHLGNAWASTLLGFLALVLGLVPVLIIWKGRWLRERSPFMLSKGQTLEEDA